MESEEPTVIEYFVAATLNNEGKVFEWNPEAHDESLRRNGEKLPSARHTLCLKKAILGAEAKEGELNLIELTTKGLDGEEIRVPLAYLQTGSMYQTSLDLSLPEYVVKLSLVKGSGPVHVLGQHVISSPGLDEEDNDIDEEEAAGLEESEEEISKEPTVKVSKEETNEKKRKNEVETNGDVKKVKLGEKAETVNGVHHDDGIEVDAPTESK